MKELQLKTFVVWHIIITINETHLWGEFDGNYAGSLLEREGKWDDVPSFVVLSIFKAFQEQNEPRVEKKYFGRDNKNNSNEKGLGTYPLVPENLLLTMPSHRKNRLDHQHVE